jgi:choline kinase
MRAVILAAGRGGRLRGVTGGHPKCLARVGARTLIDRQLAALRGAGVKSITVVAGYGAAEVRRACGNSVEFAINSRFSTTNSLYSLWLIRDVLADGFVVLNADVLFHPRILIDLMTARYDDALLVDWRRDDAPYSDEEMKVRVRRGRVLDISKTIDADQADGENMGIARFSRDGAAVLIEEMDRLIAAGGAREWLPSAFAAFSRRRPLHVVANRGLPWIEIDFPEDYWRACTDVLPAIEADEEWRASNVRAVLQPA